jgi:hypothetical protein
MGRLYTIVYVKKSELRDSLIDQILGEEETKTDFNGVYEYFYAKNGKLQKNIDYKIKAYKTLNGAQREASKITRLKSGKTIRTKNGFYDDENRRWTYEVKFEASKHSLIVIDITDKWNEMIDRDIEKKKISFELEIQKLRQKKITQ